MVALPDEPPCYNKSAAEQAKGGAVDVVRNCLKPPPNSYHLPARILAPVERRDLVGWGWYFVDRCGLNPSWWHARPPKDWSQKETQVAEGASETPLLTFVDGQGRERLHVVAGTDSETPYVKVIPFITFVATHDTEQGISVVRVTVMGGATELDRFQLPTGESSKATQDALMAQAHARCDETIPKWRNPAALWQ